MSRSLALQFLFMALFVAFPDVANAASDEASKVHLGSGEVYQASLKALMILFVLAVLVENALAVIFNWRVFLAYFSLRGVRTIIMVVVSFVLVNAFDVDVVSALLSAYYEPDTPLKSDTFTQIMTALIISGGSSGVHNLMYVLGYRDSRRETEVNPTPPRNAAWIAVTVRRVNSVGPVHVEVTEEPNVPAGACSIAGTCQAVRPGLISLLVRNANRFPSNGGYEVRPSVAYRISVSGKNDNGEVLREEVSGGPVVLAQGAIVDFQTVL